ncbi:hypothetical protein [Candidatus Cardinium sp. TP]|uniref:hypothetical protein n=1 Tax=Candidatus Cardinium sp. TP TaxID=2961955 RepID=UPI0021AF8D37|nr:hypothetical protein [Candidatus Cardinium sp. TP]MCT4697344.1 hypothetical protein [Candidatus Cardinium sp. TP]MDN5247209.1 hypothetical protein [Candidatus Cardinium sp.]
MRRYLIIFILLVVRLDVPLALPHLFSFDDYVTAIYQRQNFTEEEDFESIKQALREAYATPLDLNKATEESLAVLGILSVNQIKNYFNHLATTGPLYSKYELQAIPDFDLTTIALLLPFVYVPETYHLPSNFLKINENKSSYFLCRYTPSLNKTTQLSTLGNLDQCMVQLCCNHNDAITWGITGRKQAGESFCWDHATYRYGFNLWSVFVMVNHKKYIKKIVIGDYQVGYGQGLLLSAGYIQSGGAVCSIVRSNNVGIRPYKSIRRIGLRGVAITSDLGPIEATGFYANHNLDATLQRNLNNQLYIHQIDCIGKYDTVHKLAKKGTVNEQVVGCTIRKPYHRGQTEVGINLLYHHYDIPIINKRVAEEPYGSQSAASLFYRLLWKNWILFGEAGFTVPNTIKAKQGKALITGCVVSFSRYVDLSGALYYYGKGLHTPYGNAFKRYTTGHANEKGGYLCVQVTPLPSWQLATSGHFFATLFPKPQLSKASSGYRFTTRSNYMLHRTTLLVVQHKLHKNPRNKPKTACESAMIVSSTQNSLKCKVDHKLTHYWWTQAEIQYTQYTFLGETDRGYAVSSIQKWKGSQWQLVGKATYFNTPNYTTRLYFYLPNPLYSSRQFYPYYGNGIDATGLVCWKPIGWVRLEIKYSFIYYIKDLPKTEAAQSKRPSPSRGSQCGMIQLLVRF